MAGIPGIPRRHRPKLGGIRVTARTGCRQFRNRDSRQPDPKNGTLDAQIAGTDIEPVAAPVLLDFMSRTTATHRPNQPEATLLERVSQTVLPTDPPFLVVLTSSSRASGPGR